MIAASMAPAAAEGYSLWLGGDSGNSVT